MKPTQPGVGCLARRLVALSMLAPLATGCKPGNEPVAIGTDPVASETTENLEEKRIENERLDKIHAETLAALEAHWAKLRAQSPEERRAQETAMHEKTIAEARERREAEEAAELERAIQAEIPVIAEQIIVTNDPYKRTSLLQGPIIRNGSLCQDRSSGQLYLYAAVDAYNDTAADSSGTQFLVNPVNRPWCGHSTVELSEEYLRDHAKTGFSIKFWGGARDVTIPVSAAYVRAFLDAAGLDSTVHERPAKTGR